MYMIQGCKPLPLPPPGWSPPHPLWDWVGAGLLGPHSDLSVYLHYNHSSKAIRPREFSRHPRSFKM